MIETWYALVMLLWLVSTAFFVAGWICREAVEKFNSLLLRRIISVSLAFAFCLLGVVAAAYTNDYSWLSLPIGCLTGYCLLRVKND